MIDSNDKQFIDTNELSIHPEALRTPRMVESQYEALKLDIEQNGQIEPIVLYRGKIVDGKSILYSETNENGDLITQVISAWLNAYVDNAKDPYIALINNNTKTAPTVFMLLRAGLDPKWVNMFVSQPIIKKYVENLKYDERRFKEEKFATTITLGVDASGALYKSTRTNTYVNAITKTLMDLGYNINEIETNIDDSTLNSNEKLMKQLIYPDMMSQLEMFKKFIQLQAFANDLNNTVAACKFDTSAAGMDIAENLSMEYKKQEVRHGPPYQMRVSDEDVEKMFSDEGFKVLNVDNEVGEDIPEGKSHYLISFQK